MKWSVRVDEYSTECERNQLLHFEELTDADIDGQGLDYDESQHFNAKKTRRKHKKQDEADNEKEGEKDSNGFLYDEDELLVDCAVFSPSAFKLFSVNHV